MTLILNTTFVLWLTAQSVHCTLLQPGCTIIFNGLDLTQFSVANGTAGGELQLPYRIRVKRDIKRHPHVFMIAPAHVDKVDKVDNVDSVDSVDRQHYVTADC